MGGGYSDVYAAFAQEAVANARNGQVNILVLPLAYSIPPDGSTDAERAANVLDTEERRFQIEEACKRAAPPDVSCQAALGAPSHTVVVPDQAEELKIPAGTTGLLLTAKDQSKVVVSLLDVFTPGDVVKPSVADVKAAPARVPTPDLPIHTPTSPPLLRQPARRHPCQPQPLRLHRRRPLHPPRRQHRRSTMCPPLCPLPAALRSCRWPSGLD